VLMGEWVEVIPSVMLLSGLRGSLAQSVVDVAEYKIVLPASE
jgi:hypothetical protein